MAKRKKNTEEQETLPVVVEPPKAPPPKVRSFRTELDIILTDEEIKQRGIQVAYLYRDIGRAESELKDLVKEKKQDIARIEMKLQAVADEVREGKRRGEVLCEESKLFDILRVVQVRTDTGEEILNRPFSDEEAKEFKHPPLPFEKDKQEDIPLPPADDVAVIGGEDDVDEGLVVGEPRDGSEERDWPEKDEDDDSDEEDRDEDEE